jgi:hypothetical protein
LAGIPGASGAFRTSPCGDCRALAGACGDVVRDQCGMLRCPCCNRLRRAGRGQCSRQIGRWPQVREDLRPGEHRPAQASIDRVAAARWSVRAGALVRVDRQVSPHDLIAMPPSGSRTCPSTTRLFHWTFGRQR